MTPEVAEAPPVPISADVRSWLLDVFRTCNERVARVVTDGPTTHETGTLGPRCSPGTFDLAIACSLAQVCMT